MLLRKHQYSASFSIEMVASIDEIQTRPLYHHQVGECNHLVRRRNYDQPEHIALMASVSSRHLVLELFQMEFHEDVLPMPISMKIMKLAQPTRIKLEKFTKIGFKTLIATRKVLSRPSPGNETSNSTLCLSIGRA